MRDFVANIRLGVLCLLGMVAVASAAPGDEDLFYLGIGDRIPTEIAKAGPGASVAWAWTGSMTSTKLADGWCSVYNHQAGVWGDDCSSGPAAGGWVFCSTQPDRHTSDPGIECSAKGDPTIPGNPGSVSCSAFADNTSTNPSGADSFCSVGADGINQNVECSVEENGNGSASQTMTCSVHDAGTDTSGGSGADTTGTSQCSVQGGQGSGRNDFCSATGNQGGASGHCSASSTSTRDDSCSVVAGSGDTCTAVAGSTATCSTQGGAAGRCSSFAQGAGAGRLNGAQVQNGNNLPPGVTTCN